MTVARPVRLTAALALGGVVLAGCGEAVQQAGRPAGLAPAARVDAAVSSLLDTDRLTVTAGLDLDEANTAAISALAADDEVSPAVVQRVLGARVVATTVASEGLLSDLTWSSAPGTVPAVSTSVALQVEGASIAEVRQVGTVVYARADLPAAEAAFEVEDLAGDLTTGAEGAPAEVAGALDALVAGEWVSLDTADLVEQLAAMGAPAPQPADEDTDRAAAAIEGFLSEAAAVLRKEVVVSETGNDAYEVTAPLDKVLTSLTPSITSLVGELVTLSGALPEGSGTPEDELAQEATSGVQEALEGFQDDLAGRTATVQVGLDGDRLASARLDVFQLVDEDTRTDMAGDGVTSLPVLLEFAHEGEVVAPDGATALDLEALLGGAGGLVGVPMTDFLGAGGDLVAVPGDEGDLVDAGAPWVLTTEELEAMGLGLEASGLTAEQHAQLLEDMGIVVTP
ncbi:hypothetical protein GCM10028777_14840 [Angustibacter speluncae]